MAKRTVADLEAALEKAKAAEAEATGGLEETEAAFTTALTGLVDGTPEQLIEVQTHFKAYISAIKANWRYRGRPVMTEEQRAKAVEATKKSLAKRKARETAGAKAAAKA